MKTFLLALALVILSGCASSDVWRISHSVRDGYTYLTATRPGKYAGTNVVKSPYSIPKYAISNDGGYLAYVSKEHANHELFIQQVSTGLRLAWTTIEDVNGELRFMDQTVTYISGADRISAKLDDVASKLKEKFGI